MEGMNLYMKKHNKLLSIFVLLIFSFTLLPANMVHAEGVTLNSWVDKLYISGSKIDAGDTLTIEIHVENTAASEKQYIYKPSNSATILDATIKV